MFEGYSPETIDFLWGVRMNNNREWFMEHKQQYLETLYEPTKALAAEISAPFVEIPNFVCKTSRIYRDMRMKPDKPYKETLWICIRRESDWWAREPCLFFEIRPDGFGYGFLWWEPTVTMMNAVREEMLRAPEKFLKLIHSVEKKSGIPLEGRSYARKKPCPDPRLEPYYNLRNMTAYREFAVSDEMFSPQLAVTVREKLVALYPLCEYLQKFTNI